MVILNTALMAVGLLCITSAPPPGHPPPLLSFSIRYRWLINARLDKSCLLMELSHNNVSDALVRQAPTDASRQRQSQIAETRQAHNIGTINAASINKYINQNLQLQAAINQIRGTQVMERCKWHCVSSHICAQTTAVSESKSTGRSLLFIYIIFFL